MSDWIIVGAIIFAIGVLLSWCLDRYTGRRLEQNPEALAEADRAWERLWMGFGDRFGETDALAR